jgi:hypothetical protein
VNLIVWLLATGLTIRFVYTFLYLFYNRHSMTEREGRHRIADNSRRSRSDSVEVITTGDIYRERRPVSKMGVF